MTYLVRTGDEQGRAHHWWARFLAYGMDINSFDVQAELDKYDSHAIISPSGYTIGDLIEFRSEQDYLMFVLRWS